MQYHQLFTRQSHRPLPLGLLVGTPSTLGPELAYSIDETYPSLTDVTNYF